jgi:hypothetical protein
VIISFLYSSLTFHRSVASVVGLTLNTPGDLAISLGTSDTVSCTNPVSVVLAFISQATVVLIS